LGLKRFGEDGLRHTQQLAEQFQLGIERTLANLATEENKGGKVSPPFWGFFILSNSMSFGRPYILDIDG